MHDIQQITESNYEQSFINCIGEPFAHGHAYVAFSRVRDCDKIRLIVDDQQLHPIGGGINPDAFMPVITNIVYSEVLNHC